jgi:glycosyltransferase involved in cell wall biosynthesis
MKRKFVVHIDGLEWRRAKWGPAARLFLRFAERTAVKFAHVIISDNKEIQRYVWHEYGRESALIEYGGDHVLEGDHDPNRHATIRQCSEERYAFAVCRIEPENNIHKILEAFAVGAKVRIVIVGNWNDSDYGRKLRRAYGGQEGYQLLDPIYDLVELNLVRGRCWAYIHGHSAGGTNPGLVEAMALGLPIIAYNVPFNRETTDNQALYFETAEELRVMLEELTNATLERVGRAMRQIAARRYTWEEIVRKYEQVI